MIRSRCSLLARRTLCERCFQAFLRQLQFFNNGAKGTNSGQGRSRKLLEQYRLGTTVFSSADLSICNSLQAALMIKPQFLVSIFGGSQLL
jgi:hypothetical protein